MKEMDLDFGGEESMNMGMSMDMQEGMKQSPIEMIKSDHRKVENLFKQFESEQDHKSKHQLMKQICNEVTVHALLEEELIYPLLRREDEEASEEGYMEHELVKFMISELESVGARDKTLEPKAKVLKELIEHHVEEEERDFLPELEGNSELENMTDRIFERKQQLMDQVMSKGMRKGSRGGSRAGSSRGSRSARSSSATSSKKAAAGRKGAAARTSSGGKRTASSSGRSKSAASKRSTSGKKSSSSSRSSSNRSTASRSSGTKRGAAGRTAAAKKGGKMSGGRSTSKRGR